MKDGARCTRRTLYMHRQEVRVYIQLSVPTRGLSRWYRTGISAGGIVEGSVSTKGKEIQSKEKGKEMKGSEVGRTGL